MIYFCCSSVTLASYIPLITKCKPGKNCINSFAKLNLTVSAEHKSHDIKL